MSKFLFKSQARQNDFLAFAFLPLLFEAVYINYLLE